MLDTMLMNLHYLILTTICTVVTLIFHILKLRKLRHRMMMNLAQRLALRIHWN